MYFEAAIFAFLVGIPITITLISIYNRISRKLRKRLRAKQATKARSLRRKWVSEQIDIVFQPRLSERKEEEEE